MIIDEVTRKTDWLLPITKWAMQKILNSMLSYFDHLICYFWVGKINGRCIEYYTYAGTNKTI